MMLRSGLGLSLAAAVAVLGPGAPAFADAAGDAVLAQMDGALHDARTLALEYAITNKEAADRPERTLAMKMLLKGEKHLWEFTSPADMKGTKVLILSPTQMYVYLPAFGKVRRIASHTKDQGFMGLSFSLDDLAGTVFGAQYTAAIDSQDAAAWKLVLTPKAGQETSYPKMEVTVGKEKKLPSELKYFDAAGKNSKTETRTGYSCEGDVCTPGTREMSNHDKGSWTRLVAKSRKVNEEIADDVFSQKRLSE